MAAEAGEMAQGDRKRSYRRSPDGAGGLCKFDELDALAAVEAVFGLDENTERTRGLNKLLIETVGRFPYPEATQILIRRSILPDAESTRAIACDELKKRPMYAFAPQLIGVMPAESSWTAGYGIYLMPGGAVVLQAKWTRNVGKSEFEFSYDMTAMAMHRYIRPRYRIDQASTLPEVRSIPTCCPPCTIWGRTRRQLNWKTTSGQC